MSKKQLLEESTIRKFMKLANLEPLSDSFVKENLGYEEEQEMPAENDAGEEVGMDSGEEVGLDDSGTDDEMDVELDAGDDDIGDLDPDAVFAVMKVLGKALQAKGIDIDVQSDDEDMGDDSEMGDMGSDMGGEEDAGDESDLGDEEEAAAEEDSEEESDEEEADEEELGEAVEQDQEQDREEVEESKLSEDELVENVLRRVTARLISEAKAKKGKKTSVKEKMQEKKKKLEEEKHVKTHQKSSKVLNKGTNKHNVYKGTPDMEMKPLKGKGGKTGKGGHEMKPLKKSHNHIVTHDKNHSKMTSKGPNKA